MALRQCYPSKAADRIVRIIGTLKAYKDPEGDLVYGPLCLTGSEVEITLFQQHLEEREELLTEIIGSVKSEPTAGTGLVSFGGLVRAVLRVDPDSPPEAAKRFTEGSGAMGPGEVIRISDLEAAGKPELATLTQTRTRTPTPTPTSRP